jgi:hypothetical protein
MSARPVIDPLADLASGQDFGMERFAPKPRSTDPDKAAAAEAYGESQGLRRDRPPAHDEERPQAAISVPHSLEASSESVRAGAEPTVQISARIPKSLYNRLHVLRRSNRASLPELLILATDQLELLDSKGELFVLLQSMSKA